jgi:hypothetical protein
MHVGDESGQWNDGHVPSVNAVFVSTTFGSSLPAFFHGHITLTRPGYAPGTDLLIAIIVIEIGVVQLEHKGPL